MSDPTPTEQEDEKPQQLPVQARRPLPVYLLSCFLGALLMGPAAPIGLLFLGYSTAALKTRGHVALAFVAVLLGSALDFLWGTNLGVTALLFGLLGIAATLTMLMGRSQLRSFLYGLAFALVALGIDALVAFLAGTTIQGQIAAQVNQAIQQLTGAGTVPAEAVTVLEELLPVYLNFWPSIYLMEGLFYALAVYIAAYFAYRKHDPARAGRPLEETDLSVHFLWVLLAALLCLAVSYLPIAHRDFVSTVGYNLLVFAAAILAIQGFAVIAYGLHKLKWHWAIRLVVYLLCIQFELMFLAPSLLGLIDIWANFRKLPRDGKPGKLEAGQKG